MSSKLSSVLCLITIGIVPLTLGQRQFNYTLKLDGKYTLTTEVDLDENSIEFEANVETTGWIGLGVSPTPNMLNSDIFIGWFPKEGNLTFGDYYGSGTENKPIMDTITNDNWELISGFEDANMTRIRFKRMFNVTDKIQDREIKDENVYLIWAYGTLSNATQETPMKHEANSRGARRINLMKPQSSAAGPKPMSSLYFGPILAALSFITRF